MLELLDTLFIGLVAVAVPAIVLALIALIGYVIYREVRGGE